MKCIDTYFSKILANAKRLDVEKEYIIPNEFDLRLIKDEIHFIKELHVKVYYPECHNISSIYSNYINIKIGDTDFYKRGKNEILCFENKDEYMKYDIYFPTSNFFTKEKHILNLNGLFSFYKMKLIGYLFEDIESLIRVPVDYMKGTFYNFIYDHHPNYYQQGKFVCKSDYQSCYVNYAKYCPKWHEGDYTVCDYKVLDIEDFKGNVQEYIYYDNNDNKYILFFLNTLLNYNDLLRLLSSESLNNLFNLRLKETYKNFMIGSFYKEKIKYSCKSKEFNRTNITYNLEINCDGIFKIKINNKLQKFISIDSNIVILIKNLEYYINCNELNHEIQFDSVMNCDNVNIVINIDSKYEKYFEILEIDFACILQNNIDKNHKF